VVTAHGPIDRDRQLRNDEDMNNEDMTTEASKVELSAQQGITLSGVWMLLPCDH